MRYKNSILISCALLSMLFMFSFKEQKLHVIDLNVPKNWPQPVYKNEKNLLTEEGFQLGRNLFYDPILSRDSTISCASCHLQATGFTHVDHALSHGIEGKIGIRNSPALMNLAWSKSFMWDGGVNHLEVQAIAPITNPVEMDESLKHVVEKLNASAMYKQQFQQVFGSTKITSQNMLFALTQFLLQLNSYNSKYDQVMRKDSGIVFTHQEQNGLFIFRQHCASCHTEPLFTNGNFENNGLTLDSELHDFGRMKITQNPEDSMKFKVPTLRNIQFTSPYMHDGRFKKLSDVLLHYTSGIHASSTLSKKLRMPIVLGSNEKVDLISFLLTLSDTEFLFNPRFSFPRK